jgi:AAA family ATP:ADP antiporter
MANPFRAFLNIRREELLLSLLMFFYFFLVITTFWILKPIKKGLFIDFYRETGFTLFSWTMLASQAELLAKVLNMVVAMIAVTVFTLLARRFRRHQLTFIFGGFFMACYVVYGFALQSPAAPAVWTFYLFGDLFSTLMVATFFAFLNDSTTPDSAKRLYGLVGLGGVLGGVFGSSFVRVWIEQVSEAGWLWICFGIAIVMVGIAAAAGRLVDRNPPPEEPAPPPEEKPTAGENPAIEGAKLVFRSPYLLSVVGIVGLYEIVSTIMDFQFTATVEHYLAGDDLRKHFSTVFTITNWTSMFVQFFLTSFVMTRFGLGAALLVLPLAALSGSVAFMAVPALWFGSLLNTADNGFSYSINQSAKEALYVPTTRDEKYKAKAFIDMFVQRFAKALAVVISLGITAVFAEFSSIRWLSLVTVVVVVIWIAAARYAGREFHAKES